VKSFLGWTLGLWGALLVVYAIIAAVAFVSEGHLSAADGRTLWGTALFTLPVCALLVLSVNGFEAIGRWRKSRRERRELAAFAALRERRERAHATGTVDPTAERGSALVAALSAADLVRVRRFAIRQARWRIARRTGCLPVYALLAAIAVGKAWGPVAELFGFSKSYLWPLVGLGVALVVAFSLTDAWRQTRAKDPLLLVGAVVEARSATSPDSIGQDSSDSSVHTISLKIRAAQAIARDGSLVPAPEDLDQTIELHSLRPLEKRVRPHEHVALLTTSERGVVGLLQDAF
jgi:hypothetical protein